jgi:hypothetical protein
VVVVVVSVFDAHPVKRRAVTASNARAINFDFISYDSDQARLRDGFCFAAFPIAPRPSPTA